MPTIWPFAPNLRQAPYQVTREYRTDIITSRSGREQARALRQTPRKRIEYVTSQTGDCMRSFWRSMATAQREQLVIPDRVRFVRLGGGGLPAGNTSITVDPVPSWITEGTSLMLVNRSEHALRTVVSIIGTSITFTETDLIDWPAETRLHPVLSGYLNESILAPLISQRGVIQVQVVFEVDPGFDPAEDAGTATTTLNGREVFLTRPNRWMPINQTWIQQEVGKVDYGFGPVWRFFPVEFTSMMWDAGYTGCNAETSDALRQFFDRMKGRRGEFYMPTWQPDMLPVSGVTAAGTTITVTGTEIDSIYSDSTTHKAIGLRQSDGTWITRTVTGIAPSGGNSVITVGAAWGSTIAASAISMLSWLPMWRFSSDILTMNWVRETVAEVRMPMQIIETLAAE